MTAAPDHTQRDPFGFERMSIVDRFGVWLSQRAIGKHLPRRSDLEILELGCGYHAKNLMALRDRTARAVGVDFQVSERAKTVPGMEFVEGRIEDAIPALTGRSFDAILFISVLEHLWEPQEALDACHQWLRPNGVLMVNVPTWRGKQALELSAFRLGLSPAEEMEDHKMYYCKRELWPLLVRAGFVPSRIDMKYHKFGLNLFAVCRKS